MVSLDGFTLGGWTGETNQALAKTAIDKTGMVFDKNPENVMVQSFLSRFIELKIRDWLLFQEHPVTHIAASATAPGVHMDMQFRSPDPEGSLWHERCLERMRRALRRMHGAVAQVRVHLEDINGPGGGVDKRCRVEVAVLGQEPVAVTATARSWQASIDAAATELRQRLLSRRSRAAQNGIADSLLRTSRSGATRAPLRLPPAG
jgi:ribosome-associated translation inhibitor RaiA